MRILVVEDEPRMAALIRQGLEEDAYAVDVVGDGVAVFNWVQAAPYDLILLDVMLPEIDGITVCRKLRSQGYTMPILMLTARDTLRDKITGLDSGADDYLVKPFALEELTARIRALSRRDSPIKTAQLSLADLVLDTATKQACRNGVRIPLSAKEYALLETLLRHPHQILSRDQIIEQVWDMDFSSESKLIEVYIHALRRKIDDGQALKLIQTVRGLGYRISDHA